MKLKILVFFIVGFMFLTPAKAYDTFELLHIEWEYADLPNLNGFHIYKDGVFIYYAFPNTRAIDYSTELSFGENTFTITAVDTAENESAHSAPYVLNIEDPFVANPIPAPKIKVESVGLSTQQIITAIKTTDSRIDGYYIRVSSTYAKAQAQDADVMTAYVDVDQNFCGLINSTGLPIVFISVTSVDNDTMHESSPTIGYKLFGNIVGTYNDNVPYQQSIVNYTDQSYFQYYGQTVERLADYCSATNLFDILPLSPKQRLDYNGDGVINYIDAGFFGPHYGASGANY